MNNEYKTEATINQKIIADHVRELIFKSLKLDNRDESPDEFYPILMIMCINFIRDITNNDDELELIGNVDNFIKKLISAFSMTFNLNCNVLSEIEEIKSSNLH